MVVNQTGYSASPVHKHLIQSSSRLWSLSSEGSKQELRRESDRAEATLDNVIRGCLLRRSYLRGNLKGQKELSVERVWA